MTNSAKGETSSEIRLSLEKFYINRKETTIKAQIAGFNAFLLALTKRHNKDIRKFILTVKIPSTLII